MEGMFLIIVFFLVILWIFIDKIIVNIVGKFFGIIVIINVIIVENKRFYFMLWWKVVKKIRNMIKIIIFWKICLFNWCIFCMSGVVFWFIDCNVWLIFLILVEFFVFIIIFKVEFVWISVFEKVKFFWLFVGNFLFKELVIFFMVFDLFVKIDFLIIRLWILNKCKFVGIILLVCNVIIFFRINVLEEMVVFCLLIRMIVFWFIICFRLFNDFFVLCFC